MGISADRIHVIYNPIVGPDLFARMCEPLEHPLFAPGERPVILAVGRLHYHKDYPNCCGLLLCFAGTCGLGLFFLEMARNGKGWKCLRGN